MFTDISWNSYITFMIVVCALYYLFIGFRFYRSDLLHLLSGRKFALSDRVSFTAAQQSKPGPVTHQDNLQEAFEKQNLFQLSQSLGDEVQAYLNEAGRDTPVKENILQSLRSLIAKYPPIKGSAFHEVVQNLIITECETNCSIHLSEKELSELWQVNGVFYYPDKTSENEKSDA